MTCSPADRSARADLLAPPPANVAAQTPSLRFKLPLARPNSLDTLRSVAATTSIPFVRSVPLLFASKTGTPWKGTHQISPLSIRSTALPHSLWVTLLAHCASLLSWERPRSKTSRSAGAGSHRHWPGRPFDFRTNAAARPLPPPDRQPPNPYPLAVMPPHNCVPQP